MHTQLIRPALCLSLLAGTLAACGSDSDSDSPEVRSAPPPIVADQDDEKKSLESGTYYVEGLRDVQDACGKFDDVGGDQLTQEPFTLTNDGNGTITIDFCSDQGQSVNGVVRGDKGTLAVIHHNRRVGNGEAAAEFDQECRIDVNVTDDNEFEGRYVENQRNRNDNMRAATRDVAECQTAFTFTMKKRD